MTRAARYARLSILSNTLLIAMKLAVGLASGQPGHRSDQAAGGAQAISQAEDQAVITALRSALSAPEPVEDRPSNEMPLVPQPEAAPGKPLSTRLGNSERLDQIAFRYYGNAAYWRLLAWANDISDPLHILPGRLLQVPSVPARRG